MSGVGSLRLSSLGGVWWLPIFIGQFSQTVSMAALWRAIAPQHLSGQRFNIIKDTWLERNVVLRIAIANAVPIAVNRQLERIAPLSTAAYINVLALRLRPTD